MYYRNENLDEVEIGYILHTANVNEFRWMNMDGTLRALLVEHDLKTNKDNYVPYWASEGTVDALVSIPSSDRSYCWRSHYIKNNADRSTEKVNRAIAVYRKLPLTHEHSKSD